MDPKVLFNDFQAQWRLIRPAVLGAVDRVGQSGWLILGEEVARFERELAAFAGVGHVVACASGLDAIEIGLRVLGLKPGDQVITTPLSAFATTLAIVRAGGTPVFFDVDHSGLLDLDKVEAYLQHKENPPSFLLPVHLYGHSLDLQKLAYLRDTYNLYIVEDCAQAIGTTSANRPVGTIGQISAISFYPTKNLGCMGDGGAMFTDSDAHAAAAKTWRNYGQTTKYLHTALGMNSRLDEVQAAIMNDALLPRLRELTRRRRTIASRYLGSISNPLITIPPIPESSSSVYHLFPVLVSDNRDALGEHLRLCGIESAVHYPLVISDQPALRHHPFLVEGDLALARHFAEHELSLPIHPYLTEREIERVVDACNSWRNS